VPRKKSSSSDSLRTWFGRNNGKGWVNCKTGGPCGRSDRSKGGYPACRPTMAQCKSKSAKSAAKRKTSKQRVNWKGKKWWQKVWSITFEMAQSIKVQLTKTPKAKSCLGQDTRQTANTFTTWKICQRQRRRKLGKSNGWTWSSFWDQRSVSNV